MVLTWFFANGASAMGFSRVDLKPTNLFTQATLGVSALVDTGASHMCVTQEQARQLGFDPEEFSTQLVTLADGSQVEAPKIRPIEIAFANRTYATEALVIGNEALMGVLPLEALDLVFDQAAQKVMVNPAHPNRPVSLAKGARV
jgi:clan AA aspartic protease